jgi:TctA family transporter
VLALATVTFITNKWWVRGLIALALGIFFGLIGTDPVTNADRFTGGWGYLGDGIQLLPLVAGLFAIPELLDGLRTRTTTSSLKLSDNGQTIAGIKEVWKNRWLALRGGVIGAFIGVLPGLGGAMADWMSYGSAVATTKNPVPAFGKGNIRGVIGPEGSNNSHKATSMIPTVLFGIPGAPFAAIVMALFMYLNFELGTVNLASDTRFFNSMIYGFMLATILVYVICLFATPYIAKIAQVPYKYYFPPLLAFIVLACVQYTGGWEDYAILAICSIVGLLAKHYKFSRPALLFGFILSERIEALTLQLTTIYSIDSLLNRPMFLMLLIFIAIIVVWGIFRRGKIEFA